MLIWLFEGTQEIKMVQSNDGHGRPTTPHTHTHTHAFLPISKDVLFMRANLV